MKTFWLTICLASGLLYAQAQNDTQVYKEKQPYKNWVKMVPKLKPDFYGTAESIRIGENLLLYQQTTGGWPKNIFFPAELDADEREEVLAAKDDVNETTIDNGATSTEMLYLARLYNATGDERFRDAVIRGFNYLFEAQYENGGWPQFYPRPTGYYTHITYNDDAMINVMQLLQGAIRGDAPFGFLDSEVKARAQQALDKGVECILNTQVVQNGKLTVWCAQHDEHTLAPAKARAYELPSLSGSESDGIVLFLMSLPNPSERVKASVEAAIDWFRRSRITNLRRERFTNADGKPDYRMVPCQPGEGPTLWARFYTLEENRPFVCDRDGIKRYDVSEIGYERRNGYSWYNTGGTAVLERYEQWKQTLAQ